MGVIQRSMVKACPHVWFERSEVKDRHLVAKRLYYKLCFIQLLLLFFFSPLVYKKVFWQSELFQSNIFILNWRVKFLELMFV